VNRLVLATGPWQTIMAASAIRQSTSALKQTPKDYLVLSGYKLSDETKQTMMSIAPLVWNWEAIIWAEDVLHLDFPSFNQENFPSYLQAFKQRVPVDKVAEIWGCKLQDAAEKIMAEAYPSAKIVIYEDGLHSYIDYEDWELFDLKVLTNYQDFKYKFKQRVKEQLGYFDCINKYCICRKHIDRISQVYLALTKTLPVPNYLKKRRNVRQLEKDFVLETLSAIATKSETVQQAISQQNPQKNKVLVLGQCFSLWGLFTWEEELSIYSKIISLLLEYNFTPIWKEHPRMTQPFYQQLVNKHSSLQTLELNLHYSYPIELFVKELNLIGCVSLTSTSLFYLKDLFEIPTYTLAKELSDRCLEKNVLNHFYTTAQVVSEHISPLKEIKNYVDSRNSELIP
jgi:hypothetical protein